MLRRKSAKMMIYNSKCQATLQMCKYNNNNDIFSLLVISFLSLSLFPSNTSMLLHRKHVRSTSIDCYQEQSEFDLQKQMIKQMIILSRQVDIVIKTASHLHLLLTCLKLMNTSEHDTYKRKTKMMLMMLILLNGS